jgi:hypothetical protein
MARRKRGKPLAPGDPRRKGIANLKPIKPGEVRNPTGKNGSEWLNAFRDFFSGKAAALPKGSGLKVRKGDTEYDVLLRALRQNIVMGSDPAIKLAIEQLAGRARQQIEVSGPDGKPLAGQTVVLRMPDNGSGPDEPPPAPTEVTPPADE